MVCLLQLAHIEVLQAIASCGAELAIPASVIHATVHATGTSHPAAYPAAGWIGGDGIELPEAAVSLQGDCGRPSAVQDET